jgi:hypothetical protein
VAASAVMLNLPQMYYPSEQRNDHNLSLTHALTSIPPIFFFFSGDGEDPLSAFLGASFGVWFQIKAQAAARVGRPGIPKGRLTPPNESAGFRGEPS